MRNLDITVVRSDELGAQQRETVRRLLDDAFEGDFTDEDWRHSLGGWHALAHADGAVVGHAAVVPRRIWVAERELRGGYVEAVAVAPGWQRSGIGTAVMVAINGVVRRKFDLGALSSGAWHFYESVGWERWTGPSFVLTAEGRRIRTAEEDDGIMVLRCRASAAVEVSSPIACEERAGDSW